MKTFLTSWIVVGLLDDFVTTTGLEVTVATPFRPIPCLTVGGVLSLRPELIVVFINDTDFHSVTEFIIALQ